MDGHLAIPDVHAYGDFLPISGNGFAKECLIFHRGGAQDHPIHARVQIGTHGIHCADAAAHLREQIAFRRQAADGVDVRRGAAFGTFQIHQMEARGALSGEIPCHREGIFVIYSHAGVISLEKTNRLWKNLETVV